MSDKDIGYDPDLLMAACIQAAATVLAADNNSGTSKEPVAIAKMAAMIRDEALLQM